MSTGKRVFLKRKLPEVGLIEAFNEIPTATISDAMGRMNAMHPRIKRMNKPLKPICAGPALTVRCRAGDNLLFQKALDMAMPGDVLLVDNEGGSKHSMMGEVLMRYAHNTRKIRAVVVDAPIRDLDAALEIDMPIYATGTVPTGPFRDGIGEVNVPISCGDIVVCPGDIVVCDGDGVIVVPLGNAEAILQKAEKLRSDDVAKIEKVMAGTYGRAWVERTLSEKGVEIIDGYYSVGEVEQG